MDSLKLTFPSFQSGQEFITETDPKETQAWLDQLAYVETTQTLNELTRTISTLNRCQQKLAHREKNLEIISQGYLTLSRHMREQHDRHKAFVDKDQYKALHKLSTEMAFGYKRLIDELTEQKFLMRKNRLAEAINYAQHYLGIMLIEQYQLYQPIPSYIWRELHLLYEYAEKSGFSDKKLSKTLPDALEPCQTIRQSYARSCLMSVIDPYHVEDNQHWQIFKYLAYHSNLAEVTANLKKYSPTRCFVIDLSDNDKPHIAHDDNDYDNDELIRLLLTNSLLENIESQIAEYEAKGKLPAEGFYQGIEASNALILLKRIYEYCDTYKDREHSRYPLMTQVDTVWGLPAIKQILNHEAASESSINSVSKLKDVIGDKYKAPFNWLAVNHSEGGICLQNKSKQVEELYIGNLVILKRYINKKPQKQWQLAISRWLQTGTRRGTSIGLEYIHGNLEFVEYLTKSKQDRTISHEVLLVRPFDQSNPFLITAKNLIGGHKIIQINMQNEARELHLTHLLETNSKISIYGARF
ncbi:hypothetical protein [Kangiella sp. HZ709]|uniref:hypothetical protein n=1 Tax=Kangiella sp. HZ709 TaxID=2666328 RepID=UPI0012B0E539|nr:hypothetical protein [Kangiella sp. HZ709]MRX27078.1 hypothetical protein [Kangiella sp. HZ709]